MLTSPMNRAEVRANTASMKVDASSVSFVVCVRPERTLAPTISTVVCDVVPVSSVRV